VFGLSYDQQGNVSSKNTQGFTFDYGNRLRQSESNGSLAESYEYDAHGRRVNAWTPVAGNIRSIYSSDGVLRHQIDERSAKAVDYVYLAGSLVARVSTNVVPGAPHLTTNPANSAPSASYVVQWTSRTSSTRYELQEAIGAGAWASLYSGTALSFNLAARPAGTFNYRVRACSALGCGGWSNTRSVVVPPAPASAPTLSAPITGAEGNYGVSWNAITNAVTYRLEERFNSGSWVSAHDGMQLRRDFTAKPAGTYAYRVTACNGVGCGPVSAARTVNVVYKPSSAPSLTTPAQSTTGDYTVTWTSVTRATTYRLDERFNGGSWTQAQNSSAQLREVTSKPAGTYSYRVFACNAAGCSAASVIASTQVVNSLGVPTLTAPTSNTTGAYSLSWSSVSGATTYLLDESTNNGSTWTQVQDGASTSASLSGRSTGTHTYRVRACNASTCGNVSTSAVTQVLLPPGASPSLGAPANNTTGSYGVTWDAVADATTYRVEEAFNGGAFVVIYDGLGSSIALSGRTSGAYTYRASACNSSGCGPQSAATTQVLLAPSGSLSLSVPPSSYDGAYGVSWSGVAFAAAYIVEESVNGGGWAQTHSGAGMSFSVSGKSAGSYAYRGYACNTSGCGPASGVASVQVTLPPSAAPTLGVPGGTINDGAYAVSWTAVAAATSYRLEESINGGGWSTIVDSASTSLSFSGRSNATYGYRVSGCNVAGCGPVSVVQSVTVRLSPPAPARLSVTIMPSGGNYRFTATWSSSPGATRYELQGRHYNGPLTSIQWTLPQQAADLSIEYYVRACDANGCSDWRGPATVQ
jgi:predicted phage tail protein